MKYTVSEEWKKHTMLTSSQSNNDQNDVLTKRI